MLRLFPCPWFDVLILAVWCDKVYSLLWKSISQPEYILYIQTKHPRRDVFANVFAAKGLHAAGRISQTAKQQVLGVAVKWCPGWVKKAGRKVFLRR